MLATVSAVAMCATSVVSMGAGAIGIYASEEITPDTVEFYVGDKKYVRNENAEYCFGFNKGHLYTTEYVENPMMEVLCADDGCGSILTPFVYLFYGFYDANDPNYGEECGNILSNYLSDNNLEYDMRTGTNNGITSSGFIIEFPEGTSTSEKYDVYAKIKDNTGFECKWTMYMSGAITPTDIKNALPEPTLIGDANEDGNVNMSDAVLIMQVLSNPDEYKLTPQGIANADIAGDGDGVTAMDALTIQLSILNQ